MTDDPQQSKSTASPFTIQQLDPQSGAEIHTLVLKERALPYRPVKISGKFRASITYYPGNPVATGQALGPEEMPTTFHGMWKDMFISAAAYNGASGSKSAPATFDGQPVPDVSTLVKIVDGIRRQGLLVQLTWDDIIRIGFLEQFTPEWHRRQDVGWEMEFNWLSQGEPKKPSNGPPEADLAGAKASLSDKLDELSKAIFESSEAFQTTISFPEIRQNVGALEGLSLVAALSVQGIEDQINSDINTIATAIQSTADTVTAIANATLEPIDAAQRVLALWQVVQDSAAQMQDALESVVDQSLFSPTVSNPVVGSAVVSGGIAASAASTSTMTLGAVMASHLAVRALKSAARGIRHEAAEQSLVVSHQTATPALIKAFIARDGQDLRFVSTAFYGTPDEWLPLMTFNQLTSSRLAAGQVVYVPQRRTASN